MAGATPGEWAYIVSMQERFSENVSERNERIERAITEALQREAARHEAAVKKYASTARITFKARSKGP